MPKKAAGIIGSVRGRVIGRAPAVASGGAGALIIPEHDAAIAPVEVRWVALDRDRERA
jgi:hypothetical protein